MPILTVVNLPGDSSLLVNRDCIQTLNDILLLDDVALRKDAQGNSWLFLESSVELDPPQLMQNLSEWGINPTIRAQVSYDQNGGRKIARSWWTNDGHGRMPEIMREEVNFPGGQTFYGRPSSLTKRPGAGNANEYSVTLDLEPLLYHKLNVAALEQGFANIEDFVLQLIEDNASY